MVIDRDDVNAKASAEGTQVEGAAADLPPSTISKTVESGRAGQLVRLRRAALDIQAAAYDLAGDADAETVSELILISAALERVLDGFQH